MAAELEAHRGQDLVGEVGLAPRAEALVQGRVSTGAGAPTSMAAMLVQRPSPESRHRPENSASVGALEAAPAAVRSSSQDAMTLPRRQTSAIVGQVELVLVELGVAQRRGLGVDLALGAAHVGMVQDVQALGVGSHQAVLDAVMDHLHEVARPDGPQWR